MIDIIKRHYNVYLCAISLHIKDDKKAVVGTGEGALDIFNYDGWGNISDRFPGHPSSVDSIVPLNSDILLTGCFDGNIRCQ